MKKVVTVGASTGLGRCIGTGLAKRGHEVTLMARRQEKIEEAAAGADGTVHAITCDATDRQSCDDAFAAAEERMGGIDTVLYAAAVGPLTRLVDATNEQWVDTFTTNVVGANNVTQAAVRHLDPSSGSVLFMSTTGASYTAPWPGLGLYQTTKAALNHLVSAWRAEVPGVNFTLVTVGECPGGEGDEQTQFNTDWDRALLGEIAPEWFDRKLLSGGFIDVEELIDTFDAVVSGGASMQVPSLTIIPRPPLG
jgi:NAD(P)-dependent dehydrogenase (short-subunit alcohol dehydrogenase family)